MTTERSPIAYRVTAVMVAAALAGGLAGCDRQKNSTDTPTSVNPARGDSAGPGGSTGPVGVPPSGSSTAEPGVTGSGSSSPSGERGANTPGASTGGLQSTAPASAASSPRELR